MLSFFRKKKDKLLVELESFLGFQINNIDLYIEAFTHPSKKENFNYQRLEFLGDAVLNIIIAHHVFDKYKNLPEGELTKFRTKLVNKQTLKEVGVKIQLEKWFRHQLSPVELEKSSIYCDTLEAIIGAIYVDKGLEAAKEFVYKNIIAQLNEVKDIEDTDFKSKIIQVAQKYKWKIKFQLENTEKRNNETIFKVGLIINDEKISEAEHYSKKQAEQLAAKEALIRLNIGD